MKDVEAQLEKLRVQTAECEMICDLATDPKKRELFTRLADHFRTLATELERALPSWRDGNLRGAIKDLPRDEKEI